EDSSSRGDGAGLTCRRGHRAARRRTRAASSSEEEKGDPHEQHGDHEDGDDGCACLATGPPPPARPTSVMTSSCHARPSGHRGNGPAEARRRRDRRPRHREDRHQVPPTTLLSWARAGQTVANKTLFPEEANNFPERSAARETVSGASSQTEEVLSGNSVFAATGLLDFAWPQLGLEMDIERVLRQCVW
ncbi:unnamed protein product, partial [Prorocentrum cordatum]